MNPVRGTLLAFVAFAAMAWGDGVVKAIGNRMTVFEIGAFYALFALLVILLLRPRNERVRDFWRMRHPALVAIRSLSSVGAGLTGIYAFVSIPFAEAYALIFMAPFLVILFSILFLKERIGWLGWMALAGGAVGVLLVVKPGLRALELGHLAAFACAGFVALSIVLVRRLAGSERQSTMLLIPQLVTIAVNAVIAGPTFTVPAVTDLALLLLAGVLGAAGQLFLLISSRHAPANAVGQAQYSQLIWAVLIGALFYQEFPDALAVAGLLVIAAAGLATVAASRFAARSPPP